MPISERTSTVADYFDLSSVFADPAQAAQAQAEQMAAAEALEQAVRAATGSAASDDGRITVEWSEAGGIDELVIDPRAMRLASDELAAQIIQVVNAARTQAQSEIATLVADAMGAGAPEPRDVVAALPGLQEQLDEIMRDTAQMGSTVTGIVERMRARAQE
jgi:YbaB/EbfC DNA-binding family